MPPLKPRCTTCGQNLHVLQQDGHWLVYDGLVCEVCGHMQCFACQGRYAERYLGRCPDCQGAMRGCFIVTTVRMPSPPSLKTITFTP